eukprot:m.29952 g.29952  ORF g.29952 m.29952 type:complete len:623 (+) comp8155_c0_seq1:61-1929(+)
MPRSGSPRRRDRRRSRSPSRSRSRSPRRKMSKHELKAYKKRKLEEKERKMKEKEKLKAMETPEEKIARRLAKKAAKAEKRQRKELEEKEKFAGYTNGDNPFGDTNLGTKFVWHKKRDAYLEKGVSIAEQERRAEENARYNRIELEKVKKARADKERELEEREEEKRREQQAKEDALFEKWMGDEETFHLEQARMRSKIRIKDGRAKPIDILADYAHSLSSPEQAEFNLSEPYAIFVGLELEDVEDLYEDIKIYEQLEQNDTPEFWIDMKAIAEYELENKKREYYASKIGDNKSLLAAQSRALESGINPKVVLKIQNILKGKSSDQLRTLKTRVKQELQKGTQLAYWERMQVEIGVHLAKARLRERHQDSLEKRLSSLREKTIDEEAGPAEEREEEVVFDERDLLDIETKEDTGQGVSADAVIEDIEPPLLPSGDPLESNLDIEILTEEEDKKQLLALRRRVLYPREQKAMGGQAFEPGEEAFSDEIDISKRTPMLNQWKDKYKPRKPRYFNRVHTGFEWNKYNQTHYDSDNPPPKVVQGYKFNIFYPDLVDKSKTPGFTVTPVPNEPGFCLLKFQAGPPYEDIAFKIVDQPWEYAYKKGFRSQYSHNILQLWFQFRRERYRR